MKPSEVVRALWDRIQARDWTGLGADSSPDWRAPFVERY